VIRIREIDHVVMRVTNLEAMLRFYCDILGCGVERRQAPCFCEGRFFVAAMGAKN
jgi:catechol 2,3-dioxygenase-like lactoylglutathione lyase family enzyme